MQTAGSIEPSPLAGPPPGLRPCCCLPLNFRDEPIAVELPFCNTDCQDDYQRERAARQRAGC